MEQNTGLTVALILVAIAVLMQAGAMLGIWLAVRKVPGQIESVRSEVKQRLDPLAQSILQIVNNSREPLLTITANLAEISQILRVRTTDADQVAAELLDKSRSQIVRVDRMVSELVAKVESTADSVQKGVLGPIHEVSAVVKGVRSGLEFLFTRRRVTNVSEATQDEQLFIYRPRERQVTEPAGGFYALHRASDQRPRRERRLLPFRLRKRVCLAVIIKQCILNQDMPYLESPSLCWPPSPA